MLHLAGIEVQDLYEDLVDPGPTASTDDVYSVCIWKITAYFQAKDNLPYERHVFRHMAPGAGETADKLLVHLRKQARNCNFGESLEENERDQLNEKLPDIEWKKKLLEVKNNTLKDAMKKVRLWESACEKASQMVNLSRETSVGTSAVGTNRGNNKTCFNCGSESHFLVVTGDVQLMAENVENVADLGILLFVARGKKWIQAFKTQQATQTAAAL